MRITDLPLGAQDGVAKQADFATFSRFKRAVLREACCQDVAEKRAVMKLLVTLWLGSGRSMGSEALAARADYLKSRTEQEKLRRL